MIFVSEEIRWQDTTSWQEYCSETYSCDLWACEESSAVLEGGVCKLVVGSYVVVLHVLSRHRHTHVATCTDGAITAIVLLY